MAEQKIDYSKALVIDKKQKNQRHGSLVTKQKKKEKMNFFNFLNNYSERLNQNQNFILGFTTISIYSSTFWNNRKIFGELKGFLLKLIKKKCVFLIFGKREELDEKTEIDFEEEILERLKEIKTINFEEEEELKPYSEEIKILQKLELKNLKIKTPQSYYLEFANNLTDIILEKERTLMNRGDEKIKEQNIFNLIIHFKKLREEIVLTMGIGWYECLRNNFVFSRTEEGSLRRNFLNSFL